MTLLTTLAHYRVQANLRLDLAAAHAAIREFSIRPKGDGSGNRICSRCKGEWCPGFPGEVHKPDCMADPYWPDRDRTA